MKTLIQLFCLAVILLMAGAMVSAGLKWSSTVLRREQRGVASWYGEEYRGQQMANGHDFNPDALTCATRDWPLGSFLRVRAVGNDASIDVEVTDRGPAEYTGCVIDLTRAAFAALAPVERGRIDVAIVLLSTPRAESTATSKIANRSWTARGVVYFSNLGGPGGCVEQTCGPVPKVGRRGSGELRKRCGLAVGAKAAGPRRISERREA